VITEALLEGMNTKYLAERTVGRSLKITPPVQFHGRIISRRILRWERRCKGELFALCSFTCRVFAQGD
jgi:hypothetical protein